MSELYKIYNEHSQKKVALLDFFKNIKTMAGREPCRCFYIQ